MDKYKITLRRKNPGVCQICLNPGHWSYECDKKRAYLYRPSALTRYKNRKNAQSNPGPEAKSKRPPKYKAVRRDRRRFGYRESSDSSDSSESGEDDAEASGEDSDNEVNRQVMADLAKQKVRNTEGKPVGLGREEKRGEFDGRDEWVNCKIRSSAISSRKKILTWKKNQRKRKKRNQKKKRPTPKRKYKKKWVRLSGKTWKKIVQTR